MVRNTIKNWLSAVFKLPVVEDFDQTNVEQSISYDLSSQPIKIRYANEGGMVHFDFNLDVIYRCPNGFPGIGFLSVKLADKTKQIDGFNLISIDASEKINYESLTEMIITKTVRARVDVEYNQVRELIKTVNITEV